MAAMAPSRTGAIRDDATGIRWWSVANSRAMRSEKRNSSPSRPPPESKPNRERREACLARLGQQRDGEAGVQAAREQDADGDVGDHPAFDRGAQRPEQRRLPVLLAPARVLVP